MFKTSTQILCGCKAKIKNSLQAEPAIFVCGGKNTKNRGDRMVPEHHGCAPR